jgi:predicted dehydrogenase/threonine dehydrogenase-like Zn-dependent dehydrogenase
MKQLLQRFDTGKTVLTDTPVPAVSGPTLLVRASASLISAGTERMLVDFGRASLIQKARQQPDKVRQVLDKMTTDGIGPTLDAVRSKLEAPIPLGYCNAGVVVETGSRVTRFAAGDRVVTNGSHAEYVRVPHTLAARVPDNVSLEAAAFTPVAAIGLQGIRIAAPTLGETVVVYGLGLIGLLTVQLLRASGCRVIGIDRNPERLALAERFGAVALNGAEGDVVSRVEGLTGGVGADAVLLTLASDSDEPVHQAAAMSRKRGRLVLVGVTGLDLRRDDFYRKELTFAVSCSYGPGRYDPEYEEGGRDYPVGYVRWTEQRNFEAVLAMMESGAVDPLPLITHRFAFADAADAYDLLTGGGSSLGVVLQYPEAAGAPAREDRTVERVTSAPSTGDGAAVIGAGNFAVRTLLPELKAGGTRLRTVASGAGTSAAVAAEKFGFERTTTDLDAVFGDPEVGNVYVLTRHDSHASLAVRALEAGKHVFVEKPLALDEAGLDAVEAAARRGGRMVMVGFNRRFAPLTTEVRGLLRGRAGPLTVVATINAGAIPRDHWTQDPEAGGGRIVGEAVHWIDLARTLVGAPIRGVSVVVAHDRGGLPVDDIAHLALSFADGSTALVHYLASGARNFPKERIECFWDGRTVAIQNWRRLERFGVSGPWFERSRGADKGHAAEVRAWTEALRSGGEAPIPLDEVLEVSRWGVRAAELARGGGGAWRASGD